MAKLHIIVNCVRPAAGSSAVSSRLTQRLTNQDPIQSASIRKAKTALKLHAPSTAFYNTFTAYGDDFVDVNEKRLDFSAIVIPEGEIIPWPVTRFEDLSTTHFEAIAQLAAKPEVVLFGSGRRLRFPHPRLTQALTRQGIGIETMDLHAACRTYNILMGEGRKVAAALLFETVG